MENPFEVLQEQLNRIEGLVRQLITELQYEKTSPVHSLSAKEASTILGIAVGTIYQNIDVIPHRKKHGRLYFFEEELLAYLKSSPRKQKEPKTILQPRPSKRIKKQ